MKAPSALSQLKSILALPTMVIIIVPYMLTKLVPSFLWGSTLVYGLDLYKLIACFILISGLLLFIRSIILFIKIGKGTLAPWNPTKKLVVKSMYRYVRNPMILGVLLLLFSESFFFRSFVILLWAATFFMVNHFYFVLKEEPDLLERFGKEYSEYKANVPRWVPRISAWEPKNK